MMKRALKAVLSSIGISQNSHSVEVAPSYSDAAPSELNHVQKNGKGRGRKAHKPSGIAKAKRAAKKLRNKTKG